MPGEAQGLAAGGRSPRTEPLGDQEHLVGEPAEILGGDPEPPQELPDPGPVAPPGRLGAPWGALDRSREAGA